MLSLHLLIILLLVNFGPSTASPLVDQAHRIQSKTVTTRRSQKKQSRISPSTSRNLSVSQREKLFASSTNVKSPSKSSRQNNWKTKYQQLLESHLSLQKEAESYKRQLEDQTHSTVTSLSREIVEDDPTSTINSSPRLPSRALYHSNNYDIETPTNSNYQPSNSEHDGLITDLVSNDGIDPDAAISCCDKTTKYGSKFCGILSKLTISLNTIRKVVALWSTGYMLDCKLTDGGHLGAECANNIRVIPVTITGVVNGRRDVHLGATITQNGVTSKIRELDEKDECFSPYCSCIHPSKLLSYKIRNRKLYNQCFNDQCTNTQSPQKCDKDPSEPNGTSYCRMRSRQCANMKDWCIPKFHPNIAMKINHVDTVYADDNTKKKQELFKWPFESDCESGKVCCRYLFAQDVDPDHMKSGPVLRALQNKCARIYHRVSKFKKMSKTHSWQIPDLVITRSMLEEITKYDQRNTETTQNNSVYYAEQNLCVKYYFMQDQIF